MVAGYGTREVARMLKMPAQRVRALARAGIVSGGAPAPKADRANVGASPATKPSAAKNELRFDFRDLLLLRMANRLMTNGLSARRVKRALGLLKEQIRGDQPLTGVQVFAEGGRLLASDHHGTWEPESGQQHLRFDATLHDDDADGDDEDEGLAKPAATRTALDMVSPGAALDDTRAAVPLAADEPVTAERWFDLGMALEDSEPHRAYKAYLHALERDPEHVEAHINIGRLCSAAGELSRAAAYLRQAIRLAPAHPVAHFNLAVTLHDLGDHTSALAEYRAALEHDANFADAHYNLAALLEETGDHVGAARHLALYQSVRT